MDTMHAPETDQTVTDSADPRAAAVALAPTVDAVRDALDHMDDHAVLSVPVGTPHENFDVVEWCAANRKPVINRFDPWPLETLLVQNAPAPPADPEPADPEPESTASADDEPTERRRARFQRFRRFGRARRAGDRTLDHAWRAADVASTRSRMTAGLV